MFPILFALIAYFGWGSGDVFTAIGSRKIGAYSMALWTILLGFVLSALYAPFALNTLLGMRVEILALNIGLGIILAAAWYMFNRALEIANPTIVGTIGASFTALVFIFSIVFLKETVNINQLLAFILVFVGLILSSLDFKALKKNLKLDKGIIFAILVMVIWGIYFTFIKIPIREIGWYWSNMVSMAVMTILSLSFIKIKKIKLVNPAKRKAIMLIFASTILVTAGTFSFNAALETGKSTIVAPIAGSYPTLFVVLSYFVFKEPLTKQQVLGVLAALVGIVALAFFGI